MPIDPRLLEMLVCPGCRAQVRLRPGSEAIECTGCLRVFPIRDGIPVMLLDQAEETKPETPSDSA